MALDYLKGMTSESLTDTSAASPVTNMDSMDNFSMFNVTINTTAGIETATECANVYCVSEEEYTNMILDYIKPTTFEYCLIVAYVTVFVVGIVGNFLVCFAVWRNHSMRTVTNYFIVNLAVADFLILICLPPTLLSDVTETWYMGRAMCKVVKYFQAASVGVSVLTLTSISIERWYAICQPLKFKATPTRAKYIISLTWIISLVIVLPELIVLDIHQQPYLPDEVSLLLTSCQPSWSPSYQAAYQFFLSITIYLLPFLFMFATYMQIAKSLWRTNILSETSRDCLHPDGKSVNMNTKAMLHTRRKVAKMLIAVVVVFGICYLPVHLLNILRYTGLMSNLNVLAGIIALGSHFLCYFNSAINPVIYSFMSAKFRKEFMIACCCGKIKARQAAQSGFRSRQYIYRYRYQSNSAGALSQNANHWNVNPSSSNNEFQRRKPRFGNGTTNHKTNGNTTHDAHIHATSDSQAPPTRSPSSSSNHKSIYAVETDMRYVIGGSRNPCLQFPEALEMNSSSVSDSSQHSKGALCRRAGAENLGEF